MGTAQTTEEATTQDLRKILCDFWLGAMEAESAEFSEKIKASELLAKYILGDGQGISKRKKGQNKPSTSDILKIVAALEKGV